MGMSRGQRHQVFVSRSIQGAVMGRFAFYWIVYHFALWHGMLIYGYLRGNMLSTIFAGRAMPFLEYYGRFFQANNSILICAAAICPFMLWDTLRVTHRIAGPIVRFKDVLQRLTRGEAVKEVQLREKDLLLDLRDAFNEFLESRQNGAVIGQADPKAKNAAIDKILEEAAEEQEEAEVPTGA